MEVTLRGKLNGVVSRPWDYQGKQGVSYALHIYSNGALYQVKVNQEQAMYYETLINEDIEVTSKLFVNGKYSLTLI